MVEPKLVNKTRSTTKSADKSVTVVTRGRQTTHQNVRGEQRWATRYINNPGSDVDFHSIDHICVQRVSYVRLGQ